MTGFCLNFKADCYKNAVNKKIYAKNLKFCIAAVFVVCQRDNHILNYGST
ncbi:hypothetical protein CUS_7588 [Ruminococcus albus 8]|uniref:Uncharacterized protein n=1 Tax=Ruminococcus albus 8 TaxID=246199 RepID=E9SH60_RUMAL|nr:hypothetical protein CUS_7588 [Ruminococcus albus 8]